MFRLRRSGGDGTNSVRQLRRTATPARTPLAIGRSGACGKRSSAAHLEAPSGFEPLFGESSDDQRSSTEQVADAVAELPAELRRIVQRVSSRTRDEADA
jgi:hypothetical protein